MSAKGHHREMTCTLVEADVGIDIVERANVVDSERVVRGAGRQHESKRTVVRRNVARNDYYNDLWQSAAFANYDSRPIARPDREPTPRPILVGASA